MNAGSKRPTDVESPTWARVVHRVVVGACTVVVVVVVVDIATVVVVVDVAVVLGGVGAMVVVVP
jgi:hypothetical protein